MGKSIADMMGGGKSLDSAMDKLAKASPANPEPTLEEIVEQESHEEQTQPVSSEEEVQRWAENLAKDTVAMGEAEYGGEVKHFPLGNDTLNQEKGTTTMNTPINRPAPTTMKVPQSANQRAVSGRTDIATLLKSDDPSVYVYNKVPDRRSDLVVTVQGANGQAVGMMIRSSFIPQDLTVFARKEDILNSPDFRRMVQRGWLVLCSTDDADRVLSSPEGQKERARLDNMSNVAHDPSANQQPTQTAIPPHNPMAAPLPTDMMQDQQPQNRGPEVSAIVQDLLNNPEYSEDNVMASLRNQAEILQTHEWNYIMVQCPHTMPRVRAYAMEHIQGSQNA